MAPVDEDYPDDEETMEERDQSDFKTFIYDAAGADPPPGRFNQAEELPTGVDWGGELAEDGEA
jgi:hypothetical protein